MHNHSVAFLTGNLGKFAIARDVFAQYGLSLRQASLDLPEIQSLNVAEVAKAAVVDGVRQLGTPAFKSDVGYYIEALGGFPGPLIKFINQTLTPAQLLALMAKEVNRRVIIRECLAYQAPDNEPKIFTHEYTATFMSEARGTGSAINQVLVIDGFSKTIGECTATELHDFWCRNLSLYHDLAKHIAAS